MSEVESVSMALWLRSIYLCIVLCLMDVSLISVSYLMHNPFLLFCNVFVSFIHAGNSIFAIVLRVFRVPKNCQAELRRELVT